MGRLDVPEAEVDHRAEKLIHEFMEHFESCVVAEASTADRKGEVFEAWAIQKIAGPQLAIEHLAGMRGSLDKGDPDPSDVPF